jgi:hypothetical protein
MVESIVVENVKKKSMVRDSIINNIVEQIVISSINEGLKEIDIFDIRFNHSNYIELLIQYNNGVYYDLMINLSEEERLIINKHIEDDKFRINLEIIILYKLSEYRIVKRNKIIDEILK